MKLVFATHNLKKLEEIQRMVPDGIQLQSLNDIGCIEEIPETAETLEGNAILKADHVSRHYGLPCFADDTGLLVNALHGAPGVYSARYAGPKKNSSDNIARLLKELREKEDRTAFFRTVIALNLDGQQHLFTGEVHGVITKTPSGEGGFGYDPVFRPEGYQETFAQLAAEVKNNISHRGKAFRKLIDFLKSGH
ncbi:non-canonical purine NTP diphosphatase [Zeaxanthinibacter sp. PT1]|uniref:non-canonical purine NTP diphosphatase n=1 Tax=Zeaxanthinibacter TaxID=561554 RepID=UPI0023496B0C|nr:non-canonical purine NTP diphosphatase [Zeaxanthinibacter sp. PT1]MDC6352331.1 non-canonical purine NTP diphosphatase [Zeaxanthinibacter sp. PT1]